MLLTLTNSNINNPSPPVMGSAVLLERSDARICEKDIIEYEKNLKPSLLIKQIAHVTTFYVFPLNEFHNILMLQS
jgi:hypothetical protein